MDGDDYNSPISFLPSCQWLCQRYIIHTAWFIFYRHTVKCPCLCKKSWLAARGLMTGAYSSVGEEKPGTQLEYNPHPGGFKMDDSYTINTSIQPSICFILPVLLALYLPFLLMLFQQFLAFHLRLTILTHFPLFLWVFLPLPHISLLLPFPSLPCSPPFTPLPPLFPIPPTPLLTWLAAWLHRVSPIKTEMHVYTHACTHGIKPVWYTHLHKQIKQTDWTPYTSWYRCKIHIVIHCHCSVCEQALARNK